VKEHVINFTRVYEALSQRNMGTEWLTAVEKKHPLFPMFNYRRMKLPTTENIKHLI
jgi:1,4-alpha-glucan branching enzyme